MLTLGHLHAVAAVDASGVLLLCLRPNVHLDGLSVHLASVQHGNCIGGLFSRRVLASSSAFTLALEGLHPLCLAGLLHVCLEGLPIQATGEVANPHLQRWICLFPPFAFALAPVLHEHGLPWPPALAPTFAP